MRKKFWSFLGFWILQITTVWMVLLPLLFFLSKKNVHINTFFIVGMVIWLGGFGLESVADYQKSRFKSNPNNKSKFISTGLWSVVRYPNYLGEILCWSGIFVSISSSLVGLEWLTIISPVWIAVLLIFVSGIPLLQQSHVARYGHLESFRTYIKKTARLIPFVW
jgi:steroid 5-alpha reductase family enzyme